MFFINIKCNNVPTDCEKQYLIFYLLLLHCWQIFYQQAIFCKYRNSKYFEEAKSGK